MYKNILLAACSLFSLALAEPLTLIPTPKSAVAAEGAAPFCPGEHGLQIGTAAGEEGYALFTALQALGVPAGVVNGKGQVELTATEREGYVVRITPEGISAEGAPSLIAATLAQLCRDNQYPVCTIEDAPLYPHRGLMLDEARSPLGADEVKKVLRLMARYKLNVLHWHLTDDQGWRIEIKSYPKLTEVGGSRAESPLPEARYTGDGKPLTAFYTQEQIRDIVAYARELGITVIPEIEIPGHASAILAAYPELGNTDVPGYKQPQVSTRWGVHSTVLAPKPETMDFITKVMEEVCTLFPEAPYIYIGGDEVPRTEWEQSPYAQQFMKEHGFTRAGQVQDFFTEKVAELVRAKGKRAVCWDEAMEAEHVPDNMIALVWRGNALAEQGKNKGIPMILCPRTHFYLDYPQGKSPCNGQYYGFPAKGRFTWQKMLRYNPEPFGDKVLGVQGNAWGEGIQRPEKLEYMITPRICALAEVAWAPYAVRPKAAEFRKRIEAQYPAWDAAQLNFREEDGTPRLDREAVKGTLPPEDANDAAFDMNPEDEDIGDSAY